MIRLSGPDAARIAEVLTGQALPLPRTLAVRRLHLLMSSHAAGRSGSPATCGDALAILLTWFRGPASYTGQDVVELQLPGNAALLERVLRAAFDAGAQPAEPGEFTFRAFLAGKLDLTEAEGIAATIAATSDGQLRAATMLRRGELGTWATGLVEHLATQLALTEAGIDFADQEDVIPISPADLARELAVIEDRLSQLLARARSWSELETLPWVVLVGAPSAGKSTLFNALLGRQRAVVHDLPGTTRDVIREPLALPRGEVMLVDIAGLDDPRNRLDEQVQSLARDAIARADLIVNVLDPTRGDVPTHDGLTVYTKADLPDAGSPPPPGKRSLPPGSERMNTADSKPPSCGDRETLHVSAVTGVGLDALRRAIGEHLAGQAVSVSGEALALRPRHEAAMRRARQQLGEAQRLLKPQVTARAIEHVELVAGCLRAALDELAGLGGRMSPDDVIGRVFATFCVGK